jgi:hypothetical protein
MPINPSSSNGTLAAAGSFLAIHFWTRRVSKTVHCPRLIFKRSILTATNYCGKNNNKPPIWEWFIPPIHGDLGDGLLLFYPQYETY